MGAGPQARTGWFVVSAAEYRIEFTIQRYDATAEDFVDIGFGSSGGWGSIDQASHMAASAIENREWETEPGIPNPEDLEPGDPS